MEEYIGCCTRNENNGIAWLKASIWKLRGVKRGFEKQKCPLCLEYEDITHILLNKLFGNEKVERRICM
jgi:hypothetical protein